MDKNSLRSRIGSERQLGFIRRSVIDDGKGRGMRLLDVDNGSGLRFSVYPDRGMDIGETEFKGVNLVWLPQTPAAPGFYEAAQFNWLRSWGGGLLTGCGLSNVGGPNTANGEEHGLHGRLSHTPAEEVNSRCFWDENGDYRFELCGKVRHSRVFGENLLLTRHIGCVRGTNAITIEDTVENQGFAPAPFMLLYHMNFGWPLVSEESVLEAAEHKITPQNIHAAEAVATWNRILAPKAGFAEQVLYHEIPADAAGLSALTLKNPKLGIAMKLEYRSAELPYLIQWRQFGCGEYVLGLEPGNCFPEGQTAMEQKGMLRRLAPGESVSTFVRVSLTEN